MQLSSCSRQPPLSLAFSTTKEKLAEAFSEYGNVLNADIVLNKAKNRSKGFGYVTFAKEEEARKAQMAMNGKILHGRVLYVDMEPNKKPEKSSFDKATTDG
ncbi:small RNA-binding protein 11, chloroplastic [Arachis hypogaea]|uniref:small RNA-binding protein 11, chloroplastic n=1 Tax=Arachis hypogaea TaxID=3818 RepID=UPI000DED12A8|nr:small RNA-binding protein 11, chloroplastic isoform X2 [Arachis hypogaea]